MMFQNCFCLKGAAKFQLKIPVSTLIIKCVCVIVRAHADIYSREKESRKE